MRKSVKFIGTLCALALAAASLAGCGNSSSGSKEAAETTVSAETEANSVADAAQENAEQEFSADITGSVAMAGSTSMQKLADAVAEMFMEEYPGITVTAEYTGSSAGIESLLSGSADIGNSSRDLTEDEKKAGAVENVVAIDGIAVAVDTANPVDDLTAEQLSAIYTGEITNWSEVGGEDAAIVVVGREAGSGTRGAFEELLGIEDACAYANELDSTGAVMAKVASTPGAIGYISLDVVDDSVKVLSLEGVEATKDNIVAGTYILQRPFVMATRGEISEQSEAVQALFAWLTSDAGQEVVETVGLITVNAE